jgi:hypothetical protein
MERRPPKADAPPIAAPNVMTTNRRDLPSRNCPRFPSAPLSPPHRLPRGTMTAATAMPPSPPQWCYGSEAVAAVARPESGAEGGGWSTGS